MDTPAPNATTLLIVDDDSSVRGVLGRALESFGYRVLYAADGAEALATFERHREEVDLVISDSNMPRMSGPDLYRALRASGHAVRFLSTSGGLSEATEGIPDSRWRVLQKPCTLDELRCAVQEMLAA